MERLRNEMNHSRVRSRDMGLHNTKCTVKIFVLSARHRYCEKLTGTQAHPPYQRFGKFAKALKMGTLTDPARLITDPLMFAMLTTIRAVFGCGVMPAGQSSSRPFTVSGFTTLPIEMVYTEMVGISSQVAGIATSKGGAQAFLSHLAMQTVFDVLERQGRSALLPDSVISSILNQLEVRIAYEPLHCQRIVLDITKNLTPNPMKKGDEYCIIASNTVTGICTAQMRGGNKKCTMERDATITPVSANHTSISGTLSVFFNVSPTE
ncbi:hypothetical protein KIN20_008055 [Parelaphostrongylus tenuis]|uniref:Uncharacterized protein n=1 Tax=Parelaphostrongylus tenuis TaxID=148309 RepID=A0AAD5M906_PARTN|nr:hypothetical protein KIN20_008055 [Parelaphostrongylus tenuis]